MQVTARHKCGLLGESSSTKSRLHRARQYGGHTSSSIFNSAPVEHGTQENPKSPAENGKSKPGNTPSMAIHWSRDQFIAALIVVITRHAQLASLQVHWFFKVVHHTALPRPGVVCVVILCPEGRCVFLPVRWSVYTTAMVLQHEPVPGSGDTIVFPLIVIGWRAVVLISHQHLLQEEVGCEKVSVCCCCDTRCHFKAVYYKHQNEIRQEKFPAGFHDPNDG